MGIFNKVKRFFTCPKTRFGYLSKLGFYNGLSDKEYLCKSFKIHMGYELDLDNVRTFSEKLQWLKLYDRRPEYTTMVDKYAVKAYVADRIGEEYIIPTLGVYDSFDEIDFDTLPDQFVLKCTHDSGGLVICRDKSQLDIATARKTINHFLKRDFFLMHREWPYKDVPHRIIAEKYMQDSKERSEDGLTDYKFFCFGGEPKAMFIATDRTRKDVETKFDFFDMDFNHLPFTNGHPNSDKPVRKPEQFELMKTLARTLSQGIPHVRVDFYEVEGKIYFGELTFFHWGGIVPFEPQEWDEIFGSWINLPEQK